MDGENISNAAGSGQCRDTIGRPRRAGVLARAAGMPHLPAAPCSAPAVAAPGPAVPSQGRNVAVRILNIPKAQASTGPFSPVLPAGADPMGRPAGTLSFAPRRARYHMKI